jgi:hypothetical protein
LIIKQIKHRENHQVCWDVLGFLHAMFVLDFLGAYSGIHHSWPPTGVHRLSASAKLKQHFADFGAPSSARWLKWGKKQRISRSSPMEITWFPLFSHEIQEFLVHFLVNQ